MRASYDAIRAGNRMHSRVGRAEEMVEFSAFELFFMEKLSWAHIMAEQT